MSKDTVCFVGSSGASLEAVIRLPDGDVVGSALLAHCFTCSKDIHTITRLSAALVTAGWATMAFDFTGLGSSDGDFSSTSVSSEVGDITRAAVALVERGMGPCMLLGHSLGGAAAILAAHRLHTLDRVVAIAAPSDVAHVRNLFGPDAEDKIREHGCAHVDIGGRPFPVGVGFMNDLDRHDVVAAASQLTIPLLVVEAGADSVVGADQTHRLAAASDGSTLVTIDGADHLFSDREHATRLADEIVRWIAIT